MLFYGILKRQEKMGLTAIQNEIQKALIKFGEHSRFSEAVLAKKIREECKLEGKKKAGIALADIEAAAAFLEETQGFHYSFMLNSANEILIEKTEESRFLAGETRQRRLKSEKSKPVFTSFDVTAKPAAKPNRHGAASPKKRTERKSIPLTEDFSAWE